MDNNQFAVRAMVPRLVRERQPEGHSIDRAADADGAGRYRQACRDAETARLLLAELARWHGPMA